MLHTEPDELINHPTLVENVRTLADDDLSFDLCVLERQLPLAVKLIESCPRTTFVLDHCGNPRIQDGALDAWRAWVRTASDLPNVVCKISGIVTNADHSHWTAEDLRPCVEHVIASFGWDRVLFGSDWPVCTLAASFRQWLDALLELTRDAAPAHRQLLFHDNAVKTYRLAIGG